MVYTQNCSKLGDAQFSVTALRSATSYHGLIDLILVMLQSGYYNDGDSVCY